MLGWLEPEVSMGDKVRMEWRELDIRAEALDGAGDCWCAGGCRS